MTSRQQEAPFIYDAEIEYLQGDRNSYIDTGISCSSSPDKAPDVEISFHYMPAALQAAFGIGNSGSRYYLTGSGQYGISNYLTFSFGNIDRQQGGNLIYLSQVEQDLVCKISPKNRTVIYNGIRYQNREFNDLTVSGLIYLFAANNSADKQPAFYSDYKIYYVRISDPDGKLLFDGIPVRKGDNGYMFDRVSRRLFGNSGEGRFILGPDVI